MRWKVEKYLSVLTDYISEFHKRKSRLGVQGTTLPRFSDAFSLSSSTDMQDKHVWPYVVLEEWKVPMEQQFSTYTVATFSNSWIMLLLVVTHVWIRDQSSPIVKSHFRPILKSLFHKWTRQRFSLFEYLNEIQNRFNWIFISRSFSFSNWIA